MILQSSVSRAPYKSTHDYNRDIANFKMRSVYPVTNANIANNRTNTTPTTETVYDNNSLSVLTNKDTKDLTDQNSHMYYPQTKKTEENTKPPLLPVRLRPVQENDIDCIKSLHEGWFPVRYNQEFYDSMVFNSTSTTKLSSDKILSFVAEVDADDTAKREEDLNYYQIERQDDEKQHLLLNNDMLHSSDITTNLRINDDVVNGDIETGSKQHSFLCGCIVGSFFPTSKCPKQIQALLLPHMTSADILTTSPFTSMFYIMTLGTIPKYRNQGLGSALVQRCIQLACEDKSCGIIYLHVIKYNVGAIRFYEKLGFCRVTEIQDYYIIDGVKYNCYLYAKFINGFNEGFSILDYIQDFLISIWNLFTTPFQSMLPIEAPA